MKLYAERYQLFERTDAKREEYAQALQSDDFVKVYKRKLSPADAQAEALHWQRLVVAQQVLTALGSLFSDGDAVARFHQLEIFGGLLDGGSGARYRKFSVVRMQASKI